ncbi:glycoside hydrolase family 28 protein [Scleroderma citrinum Foug A]|uniref:endo-polygalacturonase n=1 Tax=Scleroderma citrinum Foug A TaxID=1036808 RepID=A0A0C3D2X2_9AGAM|nr:glycoside hydrolase family 28 protein [Scleroderma citrinum Foug A]
MLFWLTLVSLFTFSAARPSSTKRSCVGEISSLSDVSSAVKCTTVNINSFTVPAGETFSLNLLDGTTVNVNGDIQFGNKTWSGPLFNVQGKNIQFNGNGHKWDGGGPYYWDGEGLGGSVTKPVAMMNIKISGTLFNMKVINSPAHAFHFFSQGALTVSGVTVDDSQGDKPNSKSNGKPAGHNTDGFDLNGDGFTIENCYIYNQDDCIAIKKGSNILLQGNYCSGGHGISIGSITTGNVVSGVTISGNTITNSQQALRIKTDKSATSGTVTDVVYKGNTADRISNFGVLISQSYPSDLGTPGNGVKISNISFSGGLTKIATESNADMVAVDCGEGSCTGTWDWSSLTTSGGKVGPYTNCDLITGFEQ